MDNNWLLGALCHSLVMQFVCRCTCVDNNWLLVLFSGYAVCLLVHLVDNNWLLVLFSGYAVCLQVHLRG